jgi:hypothetical protein
MDSGCQQKENMYGKKENFGSMKSMLWEGNRKYILIAVILAIIGGGVGFYVYKKKKGGFGRRR